MTLGFLDVMKHKKGHVYVCVCLFLFSHNVDHLDVIAFIVYFSLLFKFDICLNNLGVITCIISIPHVYRKS